MSSMVCIIIVNYNGRDDTVECIRSIKAISYSNYRIIVIDNASAEKPSLSEDTYVLQNAEVIVSDSNLGFAGANNLGIETAMKYDSQYILLINNDTVVEPDFLSQMLLTYESTDNVGIVTGKIYYYGEPDVIWFGGSYYDERRFEMKIDGIGKKDCEEYSKKKEIPFATGCLWLISMSMIRTVGKMCEDYFLYYEDADYCNRLVKSGMRIIYEPKAVIYHKESRSTKKGSNEYHYYNIRNYYIYIQRFCDINSRYRAYINRIYIDCKQMIQGRIPARIVFRAWKDFIWKKYGMI